MRAAASYGDTRGMAADQVEVAAAPRTRRGRSVVVVLALGAVSWAWSEVGFWATFRPDDSVGGWLLTWLAYSLVVGVVLRVAQRFPTAALAGLVVLGALYGWLVEGVVASTVYEQLPFSIVWTGVAWHGLLTVVLGWWLLPSVLRAGGRCAWAVCAGIGLAWGAWAVGWWGAAPEQREAPVVPAPASFALFVVVVTAAAAIGYAVLDRVPLRPGELRSRPAAVASIVVLAAWAGVLVLPSIPWAPLVLAPLVALAWFSLRRLGAREPAPAPPSYGVPARRLAPLALVPAVATALYTGVAPFDPDLRGEGPFFLVLLAGVVGLSVLGAAALVWALWRAWRPSRAERGADLSGGRAAAAR